MYIPVAQIMWNGWRIESINPDYTIIVTPEPDAPKGRKAQHMAQLWDYVSKGDSPGIIWMDPDIVADPHDLEALRTAAEYRPDWVHVAAHKLWPASTGRDQWAWGFGPWNNDQPIMQQQWCEYPGWFALGFTYTPGTLLSAAANDMATWHFGQVDMGLSRHARKIHIPIGPEAASRPKHLHFYPREGDATWPGK